MLKGIYIISTLAFLMVCYHGNAQRSSIIPDTTPVSEDKLNTYNYSWEQRDLKPTDIYRNTGLVDIPIDKFIPVDYHKQSYNFIFDTLLTLQWEKDSGLQSTIKFPTPQKVEKPRYKDFAIADIQFLDVDQGISSSYILSVFEDSRQSLWFGAYEGGLIRYNGYSMYNFTVDHGLPGNSIRSIYEDTEGNMWFGTAGNGFCMFDGHTITNFGLLSELKDLYVLDIKQDERGRLWVATKENGAFVITKTHILHLDTQNHLPNNTIFSIYSDDSNALWLGTEKGIAIVQKDSIVHITFEGKDNYNEVKAFQKIDSEHLWVGTENNALIYSNGTFSEVEFNVRVKSFAVDDKGSLWVATIDEGLLQVDVQFDSIWRGSFKHYTQAHGLSHNYISALFFSRGYLWMGTYGGGVNKLKTTGFNHITKNQGLGSDLVWGFLEDEHNNLWFATEMEGICKFEDSLYSHFSKDPAVLDNYIILSAHRDEKKTMYFGSYKGGAYKVKNDSLYKLSIEGSLSPLSVISIMHDANQNLWLGTFDKGAFKVEKNKITQYNIQSGILNNDVYDIYEDESGKIWLATDGGISIIDGERLINYTKKQGLPSNEIRTIKKLNNGEIWVATYGGGIITIKQDKFDFIDESMGLSSNLVMSIQQDRKGRVWAGTESGLDLLKFNNLSAGRQIVNFDKSDGLKGLDFYTNSVFLSSDNTMWWGTGKGITFLNLDKFALDTVPSDIVIEALQIKQHYFDFHSLKNSLNSSDQYEGLKFDSVVPFYNRPEMLTIPYNKRHVAFYFAAKDEPNKQNIKYIFRLFPLEDEWSLPTQENKVDYRGIPAGEYRFEVRAVSNTGTPGKKSVFHIIVKPPWWMSSWMYVFYFVLIVFIIGLLHRWRTSVLKKRQYELENLVKERTVEIQEKNEELNVLLEQITDQRNEIKSQRDTVTKHKDELEQVNTSLSQSIDYAKRIQSSLMPDYYEFSEVLQDSFMIFKPRDIVSGDFFWWANVDNKIISVVADCTGHGVPGAFMSILGVTFLREIVLKENVTEPHEILNRLREEIIQALKQKNIPGEIRDGMEMTVLTIDKQSDKASFSGANNSIYKFSEGLLHELKGQKFPVAAYPDMRQFEKTDFTVQSGDAFYMFSDGYHDQFSEKEGKKVKKSKFFSLIEQFATSEMKNQKEELIQFLEQWQGNHEQIDDILVLGFRIPEKFE